MKKSQSNLFLSVLSIIKTIAANGKKIIAGSALAIGVGNTAHAGGGTKNTHFKSKLSTDKTIEISTNGSRVKHD